MLCRHCQRTKANRPRRLCWGCYYTLGVRELYPSTSRYAVRGLGNFNRQMPLPDAPTDAEPGSEAKIQILMERARRKQQLFHPLDTTVDPPVLDVLAESLAPEPEMMPMRVAG